MVAAEQEPIKEPSRLDRLEQDLKILKGIRSEKKDKPVRIPKLSSTQMKNNQVIVLKIKKNGFGEFKKMPILNNLLYLKDNETYHGISAKNIINIKQGGKVIPLIIQPEWNMRAYDPEEDYAAIKEGSLFAEDQKVAIRAAELGQVKPKMAMSGKMIFLIIIGAIIAIAFFVSKGKP